LFHRLDKNVKIKWHENGWSVGVEFNAAHNTIWVMLEAVFTANYLTDTDRQKVQENTQTK